MANSEGRPIDNVISGEDDGMIVVPWAV